MGQTAANFNVTNATAEDIAALNLSLAYLERSATGDAILAGMRDRNVTIDIIHDGNDRFFPGVTNTIYWDPRSALVVDNGAGSVGVQSAALGLLHEGAHATDPNYIANKTTPNPQFGDNAEQYATGQENAVAYDLGEPQRFNHSLGDLSSEANATEHTYANGDGTLSWQLYLPGGQTVTSGTYQPGTAPSQIPEIARELLQVFDDGSARDDIQYFNGSGLVQTETITTTATDGAKNVEIITQFSNGNSVDEVKNYSPSGQLLNGTITSTLPDGSQIISRDVDGDGRPDQLDSVQKFDDGSTLTIAKKLDGDGNVSSEVVVATPATDTSNPSAAASAELDGTVLPSLLQNAFAQSDVPLSAFSEVSASIEFNPDGTARAGSLRAESNDGSTLSAALTSDGSSTTSTFNADTGANGYDVKDAQGNETTYTTFYDGNGGYQQSWTASDGRHGENDLADDGSTLNQTVNADRSSTTSTYDGQGNTRTREYAADGTLTSNSWEDSAGDHGFTTHGANGSSHSESYYSDGSSTWFDRFEDGSRHWEFRDADNSYSIGDQLADGSSTVQTRDSQGNLRTDNYGIDGAVVSDTYQNTDGSHGSDIHSADGASHSEAFQPDGTSSITDRAASGDYSDHWTQADGSYGNDTQGINGSTHTERHLADGGWEIDDASADGSSTSTWSGIPEIKGQSSSGETTYNVSTGERVVHETWLDGRFLNNVTELDGSYSKSWLNADGSGDETLVASTGQFTSHHHNADGSSDSLVQNADGSSHAETNGADGSWSVTDRNADGSSHAETVGTDGSSSITDSNADGSYSDSWQGADGSYGNDAYSADGSGTGFAYFSDGSYETIVKRIDGYYEAVTHNASGMKVRDDWHYPDGTYGVEVFNSNGTFHEDVHRPNEEYWVSKDGKSEADGSYTDTWLKDESGYASFGSDSFDATTGETVNNAMWNGGYQTITQEADGTASGLLINPGASDFFWTVATDGTTMNVLSSVPFQSRTDAGTSILEYQAVGHDGFSSGFQDGPRQHTDHVSLTSFGRWDFAPTNGNVNSDSAGYSYNSVDAIGQVSQTRFTAVSSSHGVLYANGDLFAGGGTTGGGLGVFDVYELSSRDRLRTVRAEVDESRVSALWNYTESYGGVGSEYYSQNLHHGRDFGIGDYVRVTQQGAGYQTQRMNSDGSWLTYAASVFHDTETDTDKVRMNTWLRDPSGAVVFSQSEDPSTVSDSWAGTDGTTGSEVLHVDGSSRAEIYGADGSSSIADYSSNGSFAESWTASDGSFGEASFDTVNGNASSSYDYADGTHGSYESFSDNSGHAETYYSGGSDIRDFSSDGSSDYVSTYRNGDWEEIRFTAASGDHYREYRYADGSYFTVLRHENGSVHSETHNDDGSHSSIDVAVDGSAHGERHSSSGALLQKEDVVKNPDGTYTVSVQARDGFSTTEQYDTAGTMLSDTWSRGDGVHGTDAYNADGSSNGATYEVDGSYSIYAKESDSRWEVDSFLSNGDSTGNKWSHEDGSFGSLEIHADGSSFSVAQNADATWETIATGTDGSRLDTLYAADGTPHIVA